MTDDELAELLDVVRTPERARATLEERVELIEAHRAIADLVMLYGWLCDSRRWDELLEHYTDDFERTLLGTLDEKVKGKEKLRELYLRPALPRKGDGDGPPPAAQINTYELRHLIHPPVVRVSDDGLRARVAAVYSLVATSGDGPRSSAANTRAATSSACDARRTGAGASSRWSSSARTPAIRCSRPRSRGDSLPRIRWLGGRLDDHHRCGTSRLRPIRRHVARRPVRALRAPARRSARVPQRRARLLGAVAFRRRRRRRPRSRSVPLRARHHARPGGRSTDRLPGPDHHHHGQSPPRPTAPAGEPRIHWPPNRRFRAPRARRRARWSTSSPTHRRSSWSRPCSDRSRSS